MLARLPRFALFLSGFAGLVYEVCWIRRGSLVFGSTVLATSTVVAVFFLGLALGSWAAGRFGSRATNPLRVYAGIEVATAILGLASLATFESIDGLYGGAYRALAARPWALLGTRAALVAIVLLPAAVAMGATLPLVCARLAAGSRRAAGAAGGLYALNTLGAAIGCAMTGLLLIPRLGSRESIVIAAVANLAAAACAWIASRAPAETGTADARRPARPPRESSGARSLPVPRAVVTGLFFVTGLVALALEVLWTRYLALVLRTTVLTYTVSLTVVLVGIVIGSALASRLPERLLASARAFAVLQVVTALYVIALVRMPPAWWQGLGGGLAVYFALLLPPAVCSGASFPLAVRLVLDRPEAIAYEVGRMTAVNIAGGIVGSLLMGFVGLPWLGLSASALATTALALAAGVVAWLIAAGRPRPRDLALAAVAVVAWLAIPRLLTTRVPRDFMADEGTLVDFREGLVANVAVVRTRESLQLKIDRWWQGQSRKTHQIMAAHVPMLLHPGARRVLVVGAGTGQTASRFLLYPVERLDVVDIEPRVFELIRAHFDAGWLADRRTRVLLDDGRNVVAHTDAVYDVISLELGQLFRPGIAAFYTAEFYARAAARLAPGGLVCQFVPLPFLGVDQFRGIVGTFVDAFPNAVLWYNTSELLLIGSARDPIRLSDDRLRLLASDPAIRADLRYSPWGGPAEWLDQPRVFLAGFLCGPAALRELSRGAARDHDDRPALEYATRDADGVRLAAIPIVAELRRRLEPVESILEHAPPSDSLAAIRAMREADLDDIAASAWIRQVGSRGSGMTPAQVRDRLERALALNPRSVEAHRLMGDLELQARRFSEARAQYGAALAIDPESSSALRGFAAWNFRQGRYDEARALYQRLIARWPEDAEAHHNLGSILGNAGDLAGAAAHFREALRWDPGLADARANLARIEAATAASGSAR
jgi:spermidine synthase